MDINVLHSYTCGRVNEWDAQLRFWDQNQVDSSSEAQLTLYCSASQPLVLLSKRNKNFKIFLKKIEREIMIKRLVESVISIKGESERKHRVLYGADIM